MVYVLFIVYDSLGEKLLYEFGCVAARWLPGVEPHEWPIQATSAKAGGPADGMPALRRRTSWCRSSICRGLCTTSKGSGCCGLVPWPSRSTAKVWNLRAIAGPCLS